MLRLVLARFAARGAVQAALLLVVALASGLIAGSEQGFRESVDRGVRQVVVDTPGTAGVRLQTTLADDSPAQDKAARRLIEQRFADVEVTVARSVTATLTTATGRRIVALADDGIGDAARLQSGDWPAGGRHGDGALGAAVQADAAAALGLAVGDEVELSNSQRLRVVGTWRAADPASPRWHGDPAVASGADGGAAGPFVVPETSLASLTGTATARWVVTPVAEGLDEQAASALATAAVTGGLVTAAERVGGIAQGALTAEGDLADAAARAVTAARAGRTAVAAPLLAAGAVALVTVLLIAGMLARVRRDEARTLRARGASTLQVAVWSLAEGALVALPGAALGWAAGGADPDRRGTAVLVGGVAALLVAGRGVAATVAGRPRRGVPAVAALAVALGLGAVLAVWQLRLHGPAGTLPAAAPALALLAAVLALTSGARPAGRLLARQAGRWRGALPMLGAVQVARGAATLAVAGVVAALGLGAVASTEAMVGSIQRADLAAAEQVAAGADVRVQLTAPDVVDAVAAPVTGALVAAVPGVDDAIAALTSTVQVGGEDVRLVAAPAGDLPAVVRTNAVPDEIARLARPPAGEPLVGGLRVGVAVTGAAPDRAGQVAVTAWLADPKGAPVRVALNPVDVAAAGDGPAVAVGVLPPGGPWSLLALDATLAGSPGPAVSVALSTPGGALPAVELSSLHARERVPVAVAADAMPVLVTADLAAARDLRRGGALSVALRRGGSVDCVIAGVVELLPGAAGSALFADLGSFTAAALAAGGTVPSPNELWLTAADPATAAVAVRGALPYRARVTTVAAASTEPVLVPVTDAARRAAAGAAALSVVGLAAAAAALVRARRDEYRVLQALGVRARGVAGLRAGELALVVAGGAVAGVAGALVAAWVCVRPLLAAAVPGAPPATLIVGPPSGLALAWAGGAALVVLAVAAAALRPTGVRGVR